MNQTNNTNIAQPARNEDFYQWEYHFREFVYFSEDSCT